MRDWFTICVAPRYEGRGFALAKTAAEFREELRAWIKANCYKSSKIRLIAGERSLPFINAFDLDFKAETTGVLVSYTHFQVKFRSKRDAVLFKLYFSEYLHFGHLIDWNSPSFKAMYKIIGRLMSQGIANQIIGVKPAEPAASVLAAMRARYGIPQYSGSFYDPSLVQNVTKTGRKIAAQMNAKIAEVAASDQTTLYSDTDSIFELPDGK